MPTTKFPAREALETIRRVESGMTLGSYTVSSKALSQPCPLEAEVERLREMMCEVAVDAECPGDPITPDSVEGAVRRLRAERDQLRALLREVVGAFTDWTNPKAISIRQWVETENARMRFEAAIAAAKAAGVV